MCFGGSAAREGDPVGQVSWTPSGGSQWEGTTAVPPPVWRRRPLLSVEKARLPPLPSSVTGTRDKHNKENNLPFHPSSTK